MTEQLQTILARLDTLRTTIEGIEGHALSEEQFVTRYLPYSPTTWSRVHSGTYKGNLDTVSARLSQAADDLDDRMDRIRARNDTVGSYVPTRFAAAVAGAHRRALDDGNDCRIVVALAPTGGGKTTIARWMEQRHGAIYVEGRQSWRKSYKAFCLDVAAAAGKALRSRIDERQAEDALIDALGDRHGTIVIDEANTQCGAVANALKMIVNRTNHVVVIFAIPEHWDEFAAANTNEVRQVVNRCQAVLRSSTIPDRDVDAFLPRSYAGDRKAACRQIAAASNDFGGYKTAKRVCDLLADTDGASDGDVAKSVTIVRLSQDT